MSEINCKICGKTIKNLSGMVHHIRAMHKVLPKEYFDKFMRKKNEGFCLFCNKETSFISLGMGYNRFCNSSCSTKYYYNNLSEEEKRTRNENLAESGKQSRFNTKKFNDNILKKYGVDNFFKLESFKKNRAEQSDDIELKKKKTFLKNYGKKHYLQTKECKNIQRLRFKESRYNLFIRQLDAKGIVPLFDYEYFLKNNKNFQYQCKCGNIFFSDSCISQLVFCDDKSHKYRSSFEDDVAAILNEFNIEYELNKRFYYDKQRWYEIDIYIDKYKLGIECHGEYFHSELFKDKNYHYDKYCFFNKKDIRLMQFFNNEIFNKREIVKSLIKMHTNGAEKIFGRKCQIKYLSNASYKEFLEINHIQGHSVSKIKIGLFYEDKLVSVLGVGKSRFNKDEFEIIRFCNKLNCVVIGGLSKLLKFLYNEVNIKRLVSYVDIRLFDGQGFLKNGFVLEKICKPNYYYFYLGENKLLLYSRQKYQKHKLKHKLENFDASLSEHQNMINNKFIRVYDAGNLKLVYNESNKKL